MPQLYVPLAELPLLPSGKIDRRALHAPSSDRIAISSNGDPIATPTEAAIASVWRELLKIEQIDRNSNFFESGGDSLLAAQVVSRLGSSMHVPLAVRVLFEFPTVAGLAKVVDHHRDSLCSPWSAATASADKGNLAAGDAPLAREQPRTRDADLPGELEATVAEVWRSILGIAAVDIDDNFFERGGNSLGAVRLSSELESRFGVALPITALFEHGTIREQARLIAQAGQSAEWSPVMAIQPAGTRPPIFLVHAIGGDVFFYASLAEHLGKDQPVYGLRARFEEGARFFSSVEEMASTYVRAIRRMVPSGPYRLGGYSGGGLIAYEMAQQLRSAGEEVSRLVMIDCSPPGGGPDQSNTRRGTPSSAEKPCLLGCR